MKLKSKYLDETAEEKIISPTKSGDLAEKLVKVERQKDELLNVVEYSLKIVKDLPCECDSYNGFTCKKHEWERKLRNTIAKAKGADR